VADLPRLTTLAVDYSEHEQYMRNYRAHGTARALALDNRGPIRFDKQANLAPEIIDAYTHYGFFIFEGLLDTDELTDLDADLIDILKHAPAASDSTLDAKARPAIGVDCKGGTFTWVKPLSDPRGGTDVSCGRHPVKMFEPKPPDDAPEQVIQLLFGALQFSDAFLRLYAHPDLLTATANINGKDFTPFNEAIFIKQPRLGGTVSWHQDGWTHWHKPDADEHTHGFNFMAQLYGCNAENGLWIVPGSHRKKADIAGMVASAGSERIAGAVPLVCRPGDVAMTCRQVVHGSFANTSADWRVTFNFGFHRRASVRNVRSGGVHSAAAFYDDAYIHERSRLIGYGIDARRQHFPDETPYIYEPLAHDMQSYRWTAQTRTSLKDYNLKDLGI